MIKKTNTKEIREAILDLLQDSIRTMSIKEITEALEKRYGIKKSPQIIKRHLELLIKRGDVKEE